MKRVKLIDGRDFVASGFPDADVIEMNSSIVKWFYARQYSNVYVEQDPYQTDPQGYLFYEEVTQDGNKSYIPCPIGVYDWELEKFFMVL